LRHYIQGRWLALIALPVGIGIFRVVALAGGVDGADDTAAAAEGAGPGLVAAAGNNFTRYGLAFGTYGTVLGVHALICWKAAKVLHFDTLNRARLLTAARAHMAGGAAAVPTVAAAVGPSTHVPPRHPTRFRLEPSFIELNAFASYDVASNVYRP